MSEPASAYPWCPEIELLLACARRTMQETDLERARRAIAAGLDWQRTIAYGQAHGLLPLLASHARALDVPDDARAALTARAAAIARRDLQLTAELLAILRACEGAGIPAVPLKGPVLSEQVYGSIALRHYRDLDILFRRADLPAVSALLTERGYDVEPIPDSRFAHDNSHDLGATSRIGRIQVELHYALMTPRGSRVRDFEGLDAVLVTRDFQGVAVRVLPEDVQFEYLCEHGAAHAWTRLEWLATVEELRRGRQARGAASAGSASARVRAATGLADRLIGGERREIFDAQTAKAHDMVVDRLVREPARVVAQLWEAYRFQMLTEQGWPERLHRSWMTFLAPAPCDLKDVPGWVDRSPLRYVLRPFGLVRRWGQAKGVWARR